MWNWNPLIGFGLGIVAWRYMDVVWTRHPRNEQRPVVPGWRVACFWGGWLAVFAALISPLDWWSAQLLTAHMLQHLLLMLVAAPLIVLGIPASMGVWILPRSLRRTMARWFVRFSRYGWTSPILITLLNAVVLWGWHVPGLYQAALVYEPIHLLEHVSLFAVSILFWHLVFGTRRSQSLIILLMLIITGMHSSILGALMTFSSTIWYPYYADAAANWTLTPLEDQQLAGLIMWIPGGLVYLGILLYQAGRFLALETNPTPYGRYQNTTGTKTTPGVS